MVAMVTNIVHENERNKLNSTTLVHTQFCSKQTVSYQFNDLIEI